MVMNLLEVEGTSKSNSENWLTSLSVNGDSFVARGFILHRGKGQLITE